MVRSEDQRFLAEEGIPTRKEVCPQCRGEGTSSAYLGAFTWDELDEMGPEFQEDYFSGRLDRECETCGGLRVIDVIDEHRATEEQIRKYENYAQEMADLRAMEAAERRFGC